MDKQATKIVIDLDLAQIISQSVTAEIIQPLINKAISAAIQDAINTATGYSSDFRKGIVKQLSDAIPHGLAVDDTVKFQHLFNAALSEAVQSHNAASIQTALKTAMESVIPNNPTSIKLSDFMQKVRGGLRIEDNESFYASLTKSDFGTTYLSLDSNEKLSSDYRALIRLAINENGLVYALTLKGEHIQPKSMPTVISQFDSLLMSMYVGLTSLVIDIDEDEVKSIASANND